MERERGYWPVKATRSPWNPSTVFYWTGTVWQNSATNDKPTWHADAWAPIGPRLLEPSEIADVVASVRACIVHDGIIKYDTCYLRKAVEILDRLSPAMEIKVGKWYATTLNDFFALVVASDEGGCWRCLEMSLGKAYTIQSHHYSDKGICYDMKRSITRPATAAEVAELRQIVPLGE